MFMLPIQLAVFVNILLAIPCAWHHSFDESFSSMYKANAAIRKMPPPPKTPTNFQNRAKRVLSKIPFAPTRLERQMRRAVGVEQITKTPDATAQARPISAKNPVRRRKRVKKESPPPKPAPLKEASETTDADHIFVPFPYYVPGDRIIIGGSQSRSDESAQVLSVEDCDEGEETQESEAEDVSNPAEPPKIVIQRSPHLEYLKRAYANRPYGR